MASAASSKLPITGVHGSNNERTFIAIKPDGVQRGIIGEIITRFEKRGFKLVGLKMLWANQAKAAGHYDDLKEKKFFKSLVEYFASGPVVAMVWQGKDAVATGRKMLGATNPLDSAPGTIRGDYSLDIGRNIIHGSDSAESAAKEIAFWFNESEVCDWAPAAASWLYEKL